MPLFFAASAKGTNFRIGDGGINLPRLLTDNMEQIYGNTKKYYLKVILFRVIKKNVGGKN